MLDCFAVCVPLFDNQMCDCSTIKCSTVQPSLFHCSTVLLFNHLCSTLPRLDVLVFHRSTVPPLDVLMFHHQMFYCSTISCPLFHHLCSTVLSLDFVLFHHLCSTVPPSLFLCFTITCSTVPQSLFDSSTIRSSTVRPLDVRLFHY